MAPPARSRREDARRNREAILRTADAAFSHRASALSLREIARRARVSRATIYRHFPDRHALAGAIVEDYLGALRTALEQGADRPTAFREVLYWVLYFQAERRPLSELTRELPDREQQQLTAKLIGVLTPPFLAAQAAGELRGDVTPAHLEYVLRMLDSAAESISSDAERGPTMQLLIGVILDGLFTRPRQPDTPPGQS